MTPTHDTLTGFPPCEGRRSFKYRLQYAGVGMSDYVFAPDHIEAELIARREFKIPDDSAVEVCRVNEGSGITGAPIRGLQMTSGAPVRPEPDREMELA